MSDTVRHTDGETVLKPRQRIVQPPLYKVLLHNDHYTSMDFVVVVLESIFNRTGAESVRIMLNVHENGLGVAGVFPADIAETKISEVHSMARNQGFPLQCSMERE